jgi:hypothetical protein
MLNSRPKKKHPCVSYLLFFVSFRLRLAAYSNCNSSNQHAAASCKKKAAPSPLAKMMNKEKEGFFDITMQACFDLFVQKGICRIQSVDVPNRALFLIA